MAAIHEALKMLQSTPWEDVPVDDNELKNYLTKNFAAGQLLVDSVPVAAATGAASPAGRRSRSNTTMSAASSASEISQSDARPSPPASDVEALQKAWGKPLKINTKENPLGVSVVKLAGKDGRGAWFARRSVHEGLGFAKWKKALRGEFPETLRTQGGPGEGNIRGIGGERRVENKDIDGIGRVEVYHLSAQFPGPTAPRDFVTLLLTSDQALSDKAAGTDDGEVPRHFMVISKPCIHPDCKERDGYIRGKYQSVEFIREIPNVKKPPKRTNTLSSDKDASSTKSGSSKTTRRKTISFDSSAGSEAKSEPSRGSEEYEDDEETESNAVEWIMITRSDPGGNVPRFMVERGTPGAIIGDASKFLDWACAKDIDDFNNEVPEEVDGMKAKENGYNHNEQPDAKSDGHLADLEPGGQTAPSGEDDNSTAEPVGEAEGIYGVVASAAVAAGAAIAPYTPAIITDRLPGHNPEASSSTHRYSTSSSGSASSSSSDDTFASASEGRSTPNLIQDDETLSLTPSSSSAHQKATAKQEKELQKLEAKKQHLNKKLEKRRAKEHAKNHDNVEKKTAAMAALESKHAKEVQKHEERYQREVAKLERKKAHEVHKSAEKRRKERQHDERTHLANALNQARAELDAVKKERSLFEERVRDLQAQNTQLVARLGRLGIGEMQLEEEEAAAAAAAKASIETGSTTDVETATTSTATTETETELGLEDLGLVDRTR